MLAFFLNICNCLIQLRSVFPTGYKWPGNRPTFTHASRIQMKYIYIFTYYECTICIEIETERMEIIPQMD